MLVSMGLLAVGQVLGDGGRDSDDLGNDGQIVESRFHFFFVGKREGDDRIRQGSGLHDQVPFRIQGPHPIPRSGPSASSIVQGSDSQRSSQPSVHLTDDTGPWISTQIGWVSGSWNGPGPRGRSLLIPSGRPLGPALPTYVGTFPLHRDA